MIINNKTPVGEVRPSQLLWTYGPGALIDLPSLSVVTLGIDRWEKDRCQPIQEARLLAAVRKVLGAQVENLRMPPFQKSELVDVWSAEANIGVPVRTFPRWMRCVVLAAPKFQWGQVCVSQPFMNFLLRHHECG